MENLLQFDPVSFISKAVFQTSTELAEANGCSCGCSGGCGLGAGQVGDTTIIKDNCA